MPNYSDLEADLAMANAEIKRLKEKLNEEQNEAHDVGYQAALRDSRDYPAWDNAKTFQKLNAEIKQLRAERDAAVRDLERAGACFSCKHFYRNGGKCSGIGRICRPDGINGSEYSEYEWRGMKGEANGTER